MTFSPPRLLLVSGSPPNGLPALLEGLGLAGLGLEVLHAPSAEQAVALLQVQDVALALLDTDGPPPHLTPEQLGHAAARLRAAAQPRALPMVVLVPSLAAAQAVLLAAAASVAVELAAPASALSAQACAALDVLVKPVPAALLRSKLQVFVDLHRQRADLAARMAELERQVRLNARMLAVLSHDIRTPLAALTLNAELVCRRAEAPGVQQAGQRIKAATSMLGRQVDHLVNLATWPNAAEPPQRHPADLALLAQARLDAAIQGGQLNRSAVALAASGDTAGTWDALQVAQALDALLALLATHGQGLPVHLVVDGTARHTLLLRVATPVVLPEPVRQQLFGGGDTESGLATPHVGPGLEVPERLARAHGGSLIGRSREREGTLFELMLPRG